MKLKINWSKWGIPLIVISILAILVLLFGQSISDMEREEIQTRMNMKFFAEVCLLNHPADECRFRWEMGLVPGK